MTGGSEMKIKHFILMVIEASGGSISGKTKLQKEMYFVSLISKAFHSYQMEFFLTSDLQGVK